MFLTQIFSRITQFGFSEDVRLAVEEFSNTSYGEQEVKIKGRIFSVYMAFIGKTNFKDKDDPRNKTLHDQLLRELNEIELQLNEIQ